ncbi:uncharacterized protein [Coffea arabica]|uniref:Uncharacterized protein n=1 Tax=Coffea arabica TaxID=13443 RepID=A0ABM4UP07_COFAR
MEWWQKLRRAWLLFTARVFKARKDGGNGKRRKNITGRVEARSSNSSDTQTGLLKLRDDVANCEYQDVHVMWNIVLQRGTLDVKEDLEEAESACSSETKEQQQPEKQSWRAFLSPHCSSAHLRCFAQ